MKDKETYLKQKAFDVALKFSQERENLIKELLEGGDKLEIKCEVDRWQKSQNLAFEIKYKSNKSGVNGTSCHWWVHFLTDEGKTLGAFFFDLDLLKENLKLLKEEGIAIMKNGGDNNDSLLLLVPIKYAYRLMLPAKLQKEWFNKEIKNEL